MNVRVISRTLGLGIQSRRDVEEDQWALIFVGSLFWWFATWRPTAFDAELYGHLALRFQAEAWAMAMMAPCVLILLGLQDPVKHWMIAVGAALQVVQFGALGYSAIFTGGEPIIGVFCWVFFARKYARMFWSATRDP